MYSFQTITRLLRVQQWYKNSVVFIALLFSANLFDLQLFGLSLIAFSSLCLISSANYIINDIKDLEKDRDHPLKKKRPLAAGLVQIKNAKFWVTGLLFIGLSLAFLLNPLFLIITIVLFLLMQAYTFWLKDFLYLDIIMIALFFVLRAVLGALALLVWISPWLIVCPFFLAMFLVASKRYSDLVLLKKESVKTKLVLKKYSLKSTKLIINFAAFFTLLSFVTYSIQKNYWLLISVPIAWLTLWRYMALVECDPLIGLQTERALKDWKLVLLSVIWLVTVGFLLYYSIR